MCYRRIRKTYFADQPISIQPFCQLGYLCKCYCIAFRKYPVCILTANQRIDIGDAEAEKQAAILRAEAKKEATIQEAAGQAEAILKIQQANADGLRMLKEANPDNAVLQIKSLEAFAKAADGKATKIIIPSEIQGIAGLTKSIAEIAADKTEK